MDASSLTVGYASRCQIFIRDRYVLAIPSCHYLSLTPYSGTLLGVWPQCTYIWPTRVILPLIENFRLTGLLSFMLSDEMTTGSVTSSDAHKRAFAQRSHAWNMTQPRFKDAFPDVSSQFLQISINSRSWSQRYAFGAYITTRRQAIVKSPIFHSVRSVDQFTPSVHNH